MCGWMSDRCLRAGPGSPSPVRRVVGVADHARHLSPEWRVASGDEDQGANAAAVMSHGCHDRGLAAVVLRW